MTYQIAVNRSIIDSHKRALKGLIDDYQKNRNVNYKNHMANLKLQREIHTERTDIHNENIVLVETRRNLVHEIPDSVKKVYNLRQLVKDTNFDTIDLEAADYI